jgi:ATP-dependent DNA ligase
VPSRQRSSSRFLVRVLPGAKPAAFPGFIEPALATLRRKVPNGTGYVHEVKLDGYRVQAQLQDGRVTLYTRSGLDWTKRFPTIAADIGRLPAGKLVIDGEVVSADVRISERSKMISRNGVMIGWCTTPLTSCISTVSTRAVPR